ncbi:LGFP repeat-containing protein [Sphingomonas sp. M1A8_2b]
MILPGVLAINAKYTALGGVGGFLGAATIAHAKTPNGKGWYRHYAGGSIYWSTATGAHEVHGLIRGKWAALGWENSFLGFPTSDETVGGANGRFSNFQGGVVYWTPATGAHEVHGAILARYLQLGAEKSFLGYPVSDEVAGAGQSRVSNFQHGQIAWSAAHGAATSWTSYVPQPHVGGPGTHPQGIPGGGNDSPAVRRRLVCAAHMDLTDDETWGSDEHGSADKQNEAVLTNDLPQDVLTMQKGAGGEMRVELTLIGQVKLSGDVLVQGTALLYEGTSESTSDLDGDLDFTVLVPRDGVISRTVTVWNEDEGGDKGVIAMTFTNFAA